MKHLNENIDKLELCIQATIKALNSATLKLSLARTNAERAECIKAIRACVVFLETDLKGLNELKHQTNYSFNLEKTDSNPTLN